jgi:hypothetical protein
VQHPQSCRLQAAIVESVRPSGPVIAHIRLLQSLNKHVDRINRSHDGAGKAGLSCHVQAQEMLIIIFACHQPEGA